MLGTLCQVSGGGGGGDRTSPVAGYASKNQELQRSFKEGRGGDASTARLSLALNCAESWS